MADTNDFDAPSAIKAVADANDGVAFDAKLQASIIRSTHVQKEIKKLIWDTAREKFLWFLFALVALLASNFLIGLAQSAGNAIGNQSPAATTSTQ